MFQFNSSNLESWMSPNIENYDNQAKKRQENLYLFLSCTPGPLSEIPKRPNSWCNLFWNSISCAQFFLFEEINFSDSHGGLVQHLWTLSDTFWRAFSNSIPFTDDGAVGWQPRKYESMHIREMDKALQSKYQSWKSLRSSFPWSAPISPPLTMSLKPSSCYLIFPV